MPSSVSLPSKEILIDSALKNKELIVTRGLGFQGNTFPPETTSCERVGWSLF